MPYTTTRDRSQNMTIRGGVTPYKLEYRPSSDTLLNVVNTLNEKQEKSATEMAKIRTTINQLPLNETENNYKQQLINDVAAKIKANPFDVPAAIQLGYDTANNAELLGKAKTEEQMSNWKKDMHDAKLNNRISDRTEQRLLEYEGNQYKFKPTYDKDGNITGGEEWRPEKTFVPRVDMTAVVQFAGTLAKPKTTGHSRETGSAITKADGTGSSSTSKTESTKTVLDAKDVEEVFKGVFQQFPGAEESLMQDYEDDDWEYKKLIEKERTQGLDTKDKDRKEMLEERLIDAETGQKRDPRSYMAYSMGFIIPHMRIDDSTTGSVNKGAKDLYGAGAGGAGAGAGAGGYTGDYDYSYIYDHTASGGYLGVRNNGLGFDLSRGTQKLKHYGFY